MNEQSEINNQEPVNEMTLDQQVICDCFMRILANRPIPHCLNISFSVINTLAMSLPKEGRMFIVETLGNLAKSIEQVTDEETQVFKAQIQH